MKNRSYLPTWVTPLIAIGFAGLEASALAQDMEFQNQTPSGTISLGLAHDGISAIDFDSDGFLDLVVGRGGGGHGLFRNIPDPFRPGNRNFQDVSAGSGLNNIAGGPWDNEVQTMIAADHDLDGDPDLYLGMTSADFGTQGVLLENDGSGQFTDISVSSGTQLSGTFFKPSTGAWGDYDLDGLVDLFVSTQPTPSYHLFRNLGGGSFSDDSAQVVAPGSLTGSYTAIWTDVNGDAWPDLVVCADFPSSVRILSNVPATGGGRELVLVQELAFPGNQCCPMGIASGDPDGDGDFDLAISVDPPNGTQVGVLYFNQGGTFVKGAPFTLGCTWGINWLDGDNDGDLDLFSAGGCDGELDYLIRNDSGGFTDISQQLLGNPPASGDSYHSIVVDYNNDGLLDLFVNDPPEFVVYENVTQTSNHWIKVKLTGGGDVNPDAIGALVRLSAGGTVQVREVSSGTSTNASEDLRAHFGLGSSTQVDWIEVVWPRLGTLAARTERFDGPFAIDSIIPLSPGAATSYCTAGTSASGCVALLGASGAPSATSASGFELTASNVEGQKDGLFFFGTNGRQANSWGSGTSFQCVTPPVARAGLLSGSGTSGLCDGAFSQDFNALWCPTCPKPFSNPGAGAVVQAQLWYRDPFNTSNQTTSLSDAVEFSVAP